MRYLVPAIVLLTSFVFFSYLPKTKTPTCNSLHTGEFYFYPKLSDKHYKLIRDSNIQKEITLPKNDTTIYKINWINDCTYFLEHVSGGVKLPPGMKRPNVYIQFTAFERNYYLFTGCLDSLTSKFCYNDTIWMRPK